MIIFDYDRTLTIRTIDVDVNNYDLLGDKLRVSRLVTHFKNLSNMNVDIRIVSPHVSKEFMKEDLIEADLMKYVSLIVGNVDNKMQLIDSWMKLYKLPHDAVMLVDDNAHNINK
jgi:hypothetical protein